MMNYVVGTLGIKAKKMWMAVVDGRTRDSHIQLNGVQVEYNEKFPNKLMYPGDRSGRPEEVYNCRCALGYVLPETEDDFTGAGKYATGNTVESYNQWLEERLDAKSTGVSAGYSDRASNQVRAARSDETFSIIPPVKGDAVNSQSIYKEMQKSEIGRQTYEYITLNNIPVEINYTADVLEGKRGETYGNKIFIYAQNTRTKALITKTIIHEAQHLKLGTSENSMREECVCFAAEKMHELRENRQLTYSETRYIIKKVKRLYADDLPWRSENGY